MFNSDLQKVHENLQTQIKYSQDDGIDIIKNSLVEFCKFVLPNFQDEELSDKLRNSISKITNEDSLENLIDSFHELESVKIKNRHMYDFVNRTNLHSSTLTDNSLEKLKEYLLDLNIIYYSNLLTASNYRKD